MIERAYLRVDADLIGQDVLRDAANCGRCRGGRGHSTSVWLCDDHTALVLVRLKMARDATEREDRHGDE